MMKPRFRAPTLRPKSSEQIQLSRQARRIEHSTEPGANDSCPLWFITETVMAHGLLSTLASYEYLSFDDHAIQTRSQKHPR